MYGINDKVYNNLLTYFQNNEDIKKVILFGSRAKGNQGLNSDIDLCIECTYKFRGTIVEDINEVVGIYSCDIVFADKLNEEIEKQILRDGVELFKR